MTIQAGAVVTSVRGLVPDPVYLAGVSQPDTDGGITRSSLLYSWITDACKRLNHYAQWLIEDWTAVQILANQPFYPIDSKWVRIEEAFVNQWPVAFVDEGATVYPTRASSNQAIWATQHRRTDHLEIGMYPIIRDADPITTLTTSLTTATPSEIVVASTTDFLNGGGASGAWIQIGSELIQYQAVASSTQLTGITRGCAGTTIAAHTAGDTVNHLGFWLKGRRISNSATTSTSTIELPEAWVPCIELYVLAQVRRSENEHAEARALMQEFQAACKDIAANPMWKDNQGTQIQAYGVPVLGPLAWQGTTVVP